MAGQSAILDQARLSMKAGFRIELSEPAAFVGFHASFGLVSDQSLIGLRRLRPSIGAQKGPPIGVE